MLHFDRPEIKAAATPALLERGCVHIIGLEPLKEQAGVRWEKIKTGIHARLEAMLRQHLGPSDFFAPLNDVAYLITMPSTSREDAEVCCLRITYDLYTSYLGQCDVGGVSFYCASQGGGDAILLEPIAREKIGSIAERAGIADPMRAPRGPRNGPQRDAGPNERPIADFQTHFLPIWDARNEVIVSYACMPQKIAFAHGASVALHDLEPRERARVDLMCLRQGVMALTQHLERGERFLMTVRVAFETLAFPIARMEFASICRDLPSDFRQYLLFELAQVPEGVPQGRLADLITIVRPYAKGVRIQIPGNCYNYTPFQGLPLQAIGLDLARPKLPFKEMHDEVTKLCTAARRYSLTTFLKGVSDLASLKIAREGNVQFLSGRAIAAPLSKPRPMTRLSWGQVVQAAAQSGAAA